MTCRVVHRKMCAFAMYLYMVKCTHIDLFSFLHCTSTIPVLNSSFNTNVLYSTNPISCIILHICY